ncbi:MAG: HlyD family efflux transporter periplasmic adaptor subunit [Hyphomicrobiaceae bacterium]|nr:HlyD family efflux transporter periplasmic adaptor subunit [Hyphomicrobiaceae bacterium]
MIKRAVRVLSVAAQPAPPKAGPSPPGANATEPVLPAASRDAAINATVTTTRTDDDRLAPAALALLKLQAEMRKATTPSELGYFIANEARVALRAQQIVIFNGALKVQTVSSLTTVDSASPLVLWFESIPKGLRRDGHLTKATEFEAGAYAGDFASIEKTYPLRTMLWVPWLDASKAVAGGMLLARATPWNEQDIRVSAYLSDAFAHAWCALVGHRRPSMLSRLTTRRSTAIMATLAAVLMAVPVPMTALAPVEIGPRETFIVTPGIEGVIRSVDVDPNAAVKAGQRLVTLVDTTLRNRAAIAEREVLVAETRYKKAAQLAFVDIRGRHEMAIARSELDLKLAERAYTLELLSRTEIVAERDGVAFFADKRDLIGKPVNVGEKLMEVADPATSEFRIDLPAADAIVLSDGARVKVFLDSDPLNPIPAKLVRASYKAGPREGQQFAFRLIAATSANVPPSALRLGMRGTAQIYSDNVPLGFYLFRRPIAAARQWTGL